MKKVISFSLLSFVLLFQTYYIEATLSESKEFFAGRMPYGIPLEQYAMEYWQWVVTLPPKLPIDSNTQKHECTIGSDASNRMIFLVSPYEQEYSFECKIASEKSILVPLLVGECDPTLDDARAKTGKLEDLWACAMDANEVFKSWDVKIDGKTIFKKSGSKEVNIDLLREILVRNAPSFTLNIPEKNSFEVEKGSYTAVVDGYYLVLNPLSPGVHTIEYDFIHEKTSGGLKVPSGNSHALYVLTVE